ncbi:hypothetical protein AX16_010195 [Volvariella volvacea WC 439]|nr:hypothetical protein AX16_010195 [Volvariella volvacea WC 439]
MKTSSPSDHPYGDTPSPTEVLEKHVSTFTAGSTATDKSTQAKIAASHVYCWEEPDGTELRALLVCVTKHIPEAARKKREEPRTGFIDSPKFLFFAGFYDDDGLPPDLSGFVELGAVRTARWTAYAPPEFVSRVVCPEMMYRKPEDNQRRKERIEERRREWKEWADRGQKALMAYSLIPFLWLLNTLAYPAS